MMNLECLLIYEKSLKKYWVFPFEDGGFTTPIWAACFLERSFNDNTPVYFATLQEAEYLLDNDQAYYSGSIE